MEDDLEPQRFVVTEPCAPCGGAGCERCHGTGVGKFFHGTKADLKTGDLLEPGRDANFGDPGRTANHVYFTGTLDAATWGAELARGEGRGRIYVVEPTGPFEDDPNLTNKRFPGNPTRSYRSRAPLRVVGELATWRGHSAAQLESMKKGIQSGAGKIDD